MEVSPDLQHFSRKISAALYDVLSRDKSDSLNLEIPRELIEDVAKFPLRTSLSILINVLYALHLDSLLKELMLVHAVHRADSSVRREN